MEKRARDTNERFKKYLDKKIYPDRLSVCPSAHLCSISLAIHFHLISSVMRKMHRKATARRHPTPAETAPGERVKPKRRRACGALGLSRTAGRRDDSDSHAGTWPCPLGGNPRSPARFGSRSDTSKDGGAGRPTAPPNDRQSYQTLTWPESRRTAPLTATKQNRDPGLILREPCFDPSGDNLKDGQKACLCFA